MRYSRALKRSVSCLEMSVTVADKQLVRLVVFSGDGNAAKRRCWRVCDEGNNGRACDILPLSSRRLLFGCRVD